jgi:ABC-type sugar transport system substrate-binding protein
MKMLKKALLSVAALSLAVSPVLAQADAAQAAPEPAAEAAEGNELFRGGIIIPTLVVLAAILVILALTDTWPFDDEPASP